MKIIKKIMMITPLMLSLSPMAPISSCSIANSIKPKSVSRITEQDAKDPIVDHEERQYVTRLRIENENDLSGVQIGSKTKIQMGITPEDVTDKSLEFESSNPDVAVVEDGCVVAKSNGHTEIKVRANMSCPQHSISTFFYVNVYSEGCKISFVTDGNGETSQTSVIAQVGSSLSEIINNYDVTCISNEGYKLDDWLDENNKTFNFDDTIICDKTFYVKFKRLVFETDSWENIIKFANQGLDKLKEIYQVDTFVGLTKYIYINGYKHEIKVIGENHDTCTETGKKAALTFQLTTLLSGTDGKALETQWDTGNCYNYTHGYLKGNLTGNGGKRSWDTTAYELLPSDLRKGIKKVNKTVWEWNSDGEDNHYVDYSDYLFALTCTEFAQTDILEEYHTEGTPYKYWVDNNYFNARIFFDANWVNKCYWLASPYTKIPSFTTAGISLDGGVHLGPNDAWYMPDFSKDSHQYVEKKCAVSFGFCI